MEMTKNQLSICARDSNKNGNTIIRDAEHNYPFLQELSSFFENVGTLPFYDYHRTLYGLISQPIQTLSLC